MYLTSTKKADKGSLSIKESVIVVKQREMENDLDFYLYNTTYFRWSEFIQIEREHYQSMVLWFRY